MNIVHVSQTGIYIMRRIILMALFALSLCLVFITNNLFAQGTSNEGMDFWVAYAGHVDDNKSRLTLFLTSKVNATVNIDLGGDPYLVNGVASAVTLIANQPQAIYIDPTEYTNVYVDTEDNLEIHPEKGIHITSDQPIVVYSHISHSARSAACLVYPTKALGHEYYAISYNQLQDIPRETRASQFTIVVIEDDTDIEITPSQDSRWLPARPAGVPFVIKLNKGDIYQFQSRVDITGSRIRTVNGCKPFAVFSGSSKTGFCEEGNTISPNNPNGQDNLYQQLLPVSAWGRNFVTAPFYNTHQGNVDIYRIQVAEDNTTVTVNGSATDANGTILSNPYKKGSIITFKGQSGYTISASNPINVTQFQTAQSCNPANAGLPPLQTAIPGDPEMIILNPIEQTLKDITVYSAISTVEAPTNIRSHFINAIIKTADAPSFTIDGNHFGSNPAGASFATNKFIRINDEYSYIIADVTQSSQSGNPVHRIRADGGFVAIAYGYGLYESYGYLAGADLRNLNQFIEPQNPTTNVPITSGCNTEPVKLYVVLPYKTTSLRWDLNDGNGIQTDPNPDANYTTETINGVLSYRYKYFNERVTYNSAGIYLIKAMSVNPAPIGCEPNETVELSLTISAPPSAAFTASDEVCMGTEATITDNSTGDISKWHWDFGDGTPVEVRRSADPFTHTYTKSGDYNITLVVEGVTGCQSAASIPYSIHVSELPKAGFSYDLCDAIKFTDQSDPVEGTIVKWSWDFGDPDSEDGNTSELQHPSHTFSKSDVFNVRLTVETDKGCVNSFSSEVYSKPTIEFIEGVTILRGGEKMLEPEIAGKGLKYKWVPSTGLSNDTIPNPVASPLEDTEYTLTVTAGDRCPVSEKVRVKVLEPDIPNAFSPNGDGINDRWAIKYLETYVRATVQIFNRYGQKVFASGQYVEPWDGSYDGKEIPVGVYYYVIEPNNGRKRMMGSITLLR